MRGVNKVIIIGNLGADPESRQFEGGGSVTNISVATSEQWTDKQSGEKREATEWHRIVLFNRLGEIAAQYLRKGSKVYIEGSLRTRKYQAQDGSDRYTTEIRADQLQMLDGAGDNNQQQGQGNYNKPAQQQNNHSQPAQNQQNNNQQQGYQGGQQQNNQSQGFNNQTTNQGRPPQQQNNQPAQGFNQPSNAPANNSMQNYGGPVDDDIPFAPHFDGQF